jgi:hypothetical protein
MTKSYKPGYCISPRQMIWAGHMTRMGQITKAYTILVNNHERNVLEDLSVDGRTLLKWT